MAGRFMKEYINLCDTQQIKTLLARYGFRFSKSLGQNFLTSSWVPRRIAETCGASASHGVLEIGPGIGSLTHELCRSAGKVISVELDKSLIPILTETMSDFDNFELISGDILKLDISKIIAEHLPGLTPLACANLPYNITTPALRALVESGQFETLTVMVQKEVAQRITAKPKTGEYGAFSLYMQYYTDPEILFEVPPESFLPRPKVTSAVVQCKMRTVPPVRPSCGADFFFQTVRAAFALRRKTLRNSLSSVFGAKLDREQIREQIAGIIADCGFSASVRGEELGMGEFSVLSDRIFTALRDK